MKGTVIIVLAILLAALIASAQTPIPANSDPAKELPTMTPIIRGIGERMPAK
jgi:hypothetical protein